VLTGLSFFLRSVSSVPPLSAIISGAASGSWAMGEPHSEQNRRQTAFPELPVPFHFLTGPLRVSLSLGTTITRADYFRLSVSEFQSKVTTTRGGSHRRAKKKLK
jgi:hypothetical protein